MPTLSEYSLTGRVAILNTSGGNEAPLLAQALAEAGASVFAVARRQSQLDAISDTMRDFSPGLIGGSAGEVSTQAGADQAMEAFESHNLPADILVNDARSMFAKPVDEISLEEWDEVLARNLRATFLITQRVGRGMAARQYGRIVNVMSELAERGMINGSAFAVSQAGLLSLTRCLALEWGRSNIRVNALGTGWSNAEDIPLEVQREELLVRYTPLRRKAHPRDFGPLLVYLCSEACDYTTGQPVYIDGGLNAHP